MYEDNKLIKAVVDGIQDKKGKKIVVADLREIEGVICDYFIICQGNTPTQVSAISDSVHDKAIEDVGERPIAVNGLRNSLWVAMDYGDVMVHIFEPEAREFYDIDNLWADTKVTELPDIDD